MSVESNIVCEWQEDQSECIWETNCGHSFIFECGSPTANEFKFCCYCGRPLKSIPLVNDDADDTDGNES